MDIRDLWLFFFRFFFFSSSCFQNVCCSRKQHKTVWYCEFPKKKIRVQTQSSSISSKHMMMNDNNDDDDETKWNKTQRVKYQQTAGWSIKGVVDLCLRLRSILYMLLSYSLFCSALLRSICCHYVICFPFTTYPHMYVRVCLIWPVLVVCIQNPSSRAAAEATTPPIPL